MEEAYKEKRNTYRKRVTERRRERERTREMKNATDKLRFRPKLVSLLAPREWRGRQTIYQPESRKTKERNKKTTNQNKNQMIHTKFKRKNDALFSSAHKRAGYTHSHTPKHTHTDTYRVKNCCFCWPKDWSHFKQADDQILCKPLTFCKQYRSSHTHTYMCILFIYHIYK